MITDDDPGTGILIGCALGALCWLAIAIVVWLVWKAVA